MSLFFFFNDTATTEIYTLSLHDALPISGKSTLARDVMLANVAAWVGQRATKAGRDAMDAGKAPPLSGCKGLQGFERSEEHTSELQSHSDLVCRLLLEKKKNRVIGTLDRD